MKYILFITLFSLSFYSNAFVVWPDSAGRCNTTLQACIDASTDGEYIEIQTNDPINENIFTNTAVSLVAGSGYDPVFSAHNSLQIHANTSSSRSISIKGLTFELGSIRTTTAGAAITFIIENNAINPVTNFRGLHIESFSNSEMIIQVNYNQIISNTSGSVGHLLYGAILLQQGTAGRLSGEMVNNTIRALGADSKGISIYGSNNADVDLTITGNEIYGATLGGIFINSTVGTYNFKITSNAFYREGTFFFPSGIHILNDTGTTNAKIYNNSMIESRYALFLRNGAGTFNATVENNLAAFGSFGFDFQASVSVSNDYNLYYEVVNNNYTPGAHALNVNPQIIGSGNARLRASSPALDTGYGFPYLFLDAPFIDADGLVRTKSSGINLIDIGAYEAGDYTFLHTNQGGSSHITTIDNPQTNGNPALDNLHITSNWNPNGIGGIYNDENEALYYSTGQWRIFNQGLTNIANGASFNVVKYAAVGTTFEHLVTGTGENNTIIDRSGLNDSPDKILQVTQNWTGIYNPHPPGIVYIGGRWVIINLDLAIMPTNSNYNIYSQEKSKSAYEHIATSANTASNITHLDNPLINGIACAQFQVTQSASQGVFNASPIGVFYDSINEKWAIFNQKEVSSFPFPVRLNMPENAAFHVVINPAQIAECTDLIFKNGFE